MRNLFLIAMLLLPASALAAAGTPNPLGEKHSNAPIEINSDKLDVFQQENRAVFTGHVVAIQDDKRLKSDVMVVFYKKPAQDPNATPAVNGAKTPPPPTPEKKADAGPPGSNDSIKRIEVEGHVLMITPTETASGLRGVYDPIGRELRLYEQVVLTKGQNTLKGDQLVYNLDTGKSVVTGHADAVNNGPGKQRVHALFMPEHDAKQSDPGKK